MKMFNLFRIWIAAALSSSLMLSQIQPTLAADNQVVKEFANAGEQIAEIQYIIGEEEKQVKDRLPDHIDAILTNGETVEVSVQWNCAGTFNDNYYYEFIPEPDDAGIEIADDLKSRNNLPYVLAVARESDSYSNSSYSTTKTLASSNIETIYNFLTDECGFNSAAACGILANIECESSFNPNLWGDQYTSYGICQWHDSRLTAMQGWCSDNGYSWQSLTGQLNYLKKELSANNSNYLFNGKIISTYLKDNVPNSAEGAYKAAEYWCINYEVPANAEAESISRGNRAKTTYWPMFSSQNDKIYTTANVNLRSAANTSAEILDTIPKGKSASVLDYSAGWYKVQYNGEQGYINATYTSTISGGVNAIQYFDDIKGTEWYIPSVQYVFDRKIMAGTSGSLFSPKNYCTRATIAMIMKNVSDQENSELTKANSPISFHDISTGSWYYNAIKWAVSNQIMSGYSSKTFGPNDTATREQFITVLYRYAKASELDTSAANTLSEFSDSNSISNYAKEAMKWAVSKNIIQGTEKDLLKPKAGISRAEAAAIIQRYMQAY